MASPVLRLGINGIRVLAGGIGVRGGLRGNTSISPALLTSPHKPLLQSLQQPPLAASLHTSSASLKEEEKERGPRWFKKYNDVRYPPTPIGEKERHAFVCHVKENIKYSPDKMWYVACLVRGLRIDEAIAQLKFVHKKGAGFAIEALEEARRMAVEEHGVEFPSNLWVAESFVSKGIVYRGFRRHARRRFGRVEYKHCHYFVTLEEGDPPAHYYPHHCPLTPQEHIERYVENLRKRNVPKAL